MSFIEVENLQKFFPVQKGVFSRSKNLIRAVDGISFSVEKGDSLGLVGESGCGKSTTGLLLIRLLEPTGGEAFFQGKPLFRLSKEQFDDLRPKMQIVFQDPQSSLNPMHKIWSILSRPYRIHNYAGEEDLKMIVSQTLERVGLNPEQIDRYPHEFSGGQRQRIAIARAIILNPEFVVLDEPTSALDVSVQAQILNLLKDLQKEHNLSYLFISHNLSVVRHMCNRVAVMYLGRIIELAETQVLFSSPTHPYTQVLLASILTPRPRARGELRLFSGEVPSLQNPPSGCTFHPRCTRAIEERCRKQRPILESLGNGHYVACHLKG